MPRTGSGRYNREDVDEKKDHPRDNGSTRGQQGSKDEFRFDDPQDLKAKGTGINRKAGGNKGGRKSEGQPSSRNDGPTDNTRPGGNRPKGGHHNQGQVDHN